MFLEICFAVFMLGECAFLWWISKRIEDLLSDNRRRRHKNIDEINCLFCFCPLYKLKNCGGDFQMLGNGIKDCSSCVRPHKRENYEAIIKELSCHDGAD